MSAASSTLTLIVAMAIAAALCRLLGYGFMRFVPLTPRVEAGLNALPLAVMIGIIGPPALRGGLPEMAGLAATIAIVRLGVNDFFALLSGMAAVAVMRAYLA